MCGIAGLWRLSKLNQCDIASIVDSMTNSLRHRGPDDRGVWMQGNIALGHQRLSIIDLKPSGHQPMCSDDGRYVLVFNGEIYNYKSISEELTKENIKHNSSSDTAVLLHACVHWGIDKSLKKLNGMFAFGLYDSFEKCLVLARDRFGEKPLYYAYKPETYFGFGSELKVFKYCSFIDKDIDPTALDLYLRFNYIPCPYSIYKSIRKLFPGHYLTVNENGFKDTEYYNLENEVRQREIIDVSEEECLNILDGKLKNAVQQRMCADVSVGAFLSGGIDSSLMVSLMQSAHVPVKTFTVGFKNSPWDESLYAHQIADYLHTDHTTLYVSSDEILEDIDSVIHMYDEPFGDASALSTHMICKKIKQYVTVAIGGDGGDELFGGYYRHQWVPRIDRIRRFIPNFALSIAEKLLPENLYPVFSGKAKKGLRALRSESFLQTYLNSIEYWSKTPSLQSTWFTLSSSVHNNEEQVMLLDMKTFLHDDVLCKVDRASMSVALETRAPFLDYDLVEFAWSIPLNLKLKNSCKKHLLKNLLKRYLPVQLWNRPKMGFGMPLADIFRNELKSSFEECLNKDTPVFAHLSKELVKNVWAQHLSKKMNHENLLWNFFIAQKFFIN